MTKKKSLQAECWIFTKINDSIIIYNITICCSNDCHSPLRQSQYPYQVRWQTSPYIVTQFALQLGKGGFVIHQNDLLEINEWRGRVLTWVAW